MINLTCFGASILTSFYEWQSVHMQKLLLFSCIRLPVLSKLWIFHTTPEHRFSYFAEILLPAVFKTDPLSRNSANDNVLFFRHIIDEWSWLALTLVSNTLHFLWLLHNKPSPCFASWMVLMWSSYSRKCGVFINSNSSDGSSRHCHAAGKHHTLSGKLHA